MTRYAIAILRITYLTPKRTNFIFTFGVDCFITGELAAPGILVDEA